MIYSLDMESKETIIDNLERLNLLPEIWEYEPKFHQT
jgi:hypothetical protein